MAKALFVLLSCSIVVAVAVNPVADATFLNPRDVLFHGNLPAVIVVSTPPLETDANFLIEKPAGIPDDSRLLKFSEKGEFVSVTWAIIALHIEKTKRSNSKNFLIESEVLYSCKLILNLLRIKNGLVIFLLTITGYC